MALDLLDGPSTLPVPGTTSRARRCVAELLERCGIAIDGPQPWDLRVHDERLWARLLRHRSLGLGEAYMDGWWTCDDLPGFFERLLDGPLYEGMGTRWRLSALVALLVNRQSLARARCAIRHHYDIGHDLYRCMLGRRMLYSCAYWDGARDLDDAQERKLDLICRKLDLAPGMRLLDIGCGWGGLAAFAAERYGVEVVGITLSPDQVEVARQATRGLPVEIRLADYRTLDERFDRICSVGMFEHVGPRNYERFFHIARRCLAEDGLLLLHTIGGPRPVRTTDPWLDRYIFPGSVLPAARQIAQGMEGRFVIEDWHAIGPHYHPTLLAWQRNVEQAWPALGERYPERFRRMWTYYLSSCAAAFLVRRTQVWQIVGSPRGRRDGYRAPR